MLGLTFNKPLILQGLNIIYNYGQYRQQSNKGYTYIYCNTSGTLVLNQDSLADIFLVGGGGGGSSSYFDSNNNIIQGGGGGGGYSLFKKDVSLYAGHEYPIIIGAGGIGGINGKIGSNGSPSKLIHPNEIIKAEGGFAADGVQGGNGGSDGGNGFIGLAGQGGKGYSAIKNEYTRKYYAFNSFDSRRYCDGGSGATNKACVLENTGRGGNGAYSIEGSNGYNGSSGIVIIRIKQ